MVLTGLQHPFSEADIRRRCGHTSLGMQLSGIADGLRDIPVSVEYQIERDLDDLVHAVQRHAWPIVGIDLRPIDGIFAFHAVVVSSITSDHVIVHDPLHQAGPRSIGQLAFKAAWNAADREVLIITAASARP